jgi:hypothetical protein
MSRQEDQETLNNEIGSLKEFLNRQDLHSLSNADEIHEVLEKIADVYIQIKQFISRYGENSWNPWGHKLWVDIERNEQALKRKLEALERTETHKSAKFSKLMAIISAVCAVISAGAAIFSASYDSPSNQNGEMQSAHVVKPAQGEEKKTHNKSN